MATIDLELGGQRVTAQETGFGLVLRTDRGCELQVETDDTVQTAASIRSYAPWEQPPSLLGERVRAATATGSGHLEVVFDSGAVVRVSPDPEFEAWTFVAPNGRRVVALPEGDLGDWSAD